MDSGIILPPNQAPPLSRVVPSTMQPLPGYLVSCGEAPASKMDEDLFSIEERPPPDVQHFDGPQNAPVDTSYDEILNLGYPGNSVLASERRDILRRTITNEIAQLPISARDIEMLADIRKVTDDIPEDDLPSSGKETSSAVLQCAWIGCDYICNRPARLKTHVYTHISFKPFPCDRTCGDPHCTARFHSKSDRISHQTNHENKVICQNCGEECTGKNKQRHARSAKCKKPLELVRDQVVNGTKESF